MKLFLLTLLLSFSSIAGKLERSPNQELTSVLSNLTVISPPIDFDSQGYRVMFYGVTSANHCAALMSCRSLIELLVVTTEHNDDEAPISNLYRLPPKHKWEVVSWKSPQHIDLKATTYLDDTEDSVIEEQYILKTSWLSAELISLPQNK